MYTISATDVCVLRSNSQLRRKHVDRLSDDVSVTINGYLPGTGGVMRRQVDGCFSG